MAKWEDKIGGATGSGKPTRALDTRASIHRSSNVSEWMRWIAVACILLLAFTATVQVAHSHADDRAADHCQICFAIHSAMPAEAVTADLVFTSIEQPAAELIHSAPPRFWISPFANGPPVLKSA